LCHVALLVRCVVGTNPSGVVGLSIWGTKRQVPCHQESIDVQEPCVLAGWVPTLRRETMLSSGGEGIVWRTGRDRLSGSRAVCHSRCRRCITCRYTRFHGCGCAAGFWGGVYEQSVRWVTASVPASDTTVESWHRSCSFTGTGYPPQYKGGQDDDWTGCV